MNGTYEENRRAQYLAAIDRLTFGTFDVEAHRGEKVMDVYNAVLADFKAMLMTISEDQWRDDVIRREIAKRNDLDEVYAKYSHEYVWQVYRQHYEDTSSYVRWHEIVADLGTEYDWEAFEEGKPALITDRDWDRIERFALPILEENGIIDAYLAGVPVEDLTA